MPRCERSAARSQHAAVASLTIMTTGEAAWRVRHTAGATLSHSCGALGGALGLKAATQLAAASTRTAEHVVCMLQDTSWPRVRGFFLEFAIIFFKFTDSAAHPIRVPVPDFALQGPGVRRRGRECAAEPPLPRLRKSLGMVDTRRSSRGRKASVRCDGDAPTWPVHMVRGGCRGGWRTVHGNRDVLQQPASLSRPSCLVRSQGVLERVLISSACPRKRGWVLSAFGSSVSQQ